MEKIYIEDNNSSKHDKNYRSTYRISIVLSFVVAAFALVSIVAFGFNQVSFAAGGEDGVNYNVGLLKRQGDSNLPVYISAEYGGKTFSIPVYMENSDSNDENKKQFFCIEHVKDPGSDYTLSGETSDAGILYILNKSAINGGPGIIPKGEVKYLNAVTNTDKAYAFVETYATQVSLWLYLYEKYPSVDVHSLSTAGLLSAGGSETNRLTNEEAMNVIKNAVNVTYIYEDTIDTLGTDFRFTDNETIYTKYLKSVIDSAKASFYENMISVVFDDKNISEVEGTNYYQTSRFKVQTSGDLQSYDLNVTDGAIIVDGNGEEIKNLSGLTDVGANYYVRIPKDKVTDEKQKITVTVNGHFNYLNGYEYVSGDAQKLITTKLGRTFSNGDEVELVGAPDTGMSTSQTIYFIGLIVLLCGVGIIYANAKPIKNL